MYYVLCSFKCQPQHRKCTNGRTNWIITTCRSMITLAVGVYPCVSGSHCKHPCLQVFSGLWATVLKCGFEESLVSIPETYNNNKPVESPYLVSQVISHGSEVNQMDNNCETKNKSYMMSFDILFLLISVFIVKFVDHFQFPVLQNSRKKLTFCYDN